MCTMRHPTPTNADWRDGLLSRGRVDYGPDFRDLVSRKAALPRVFAYSVLIRSDIDAINLVLGYIAVQPLHLGTKISENAAGFLGDRLQLLWLQISCSWNLPLDHVFWHQTSSGMRSVNFTIGSRFKTDRAAKPATSTLAKKPPR